MENLPARLQMTEIFGENRVKFVYSLLCEREKETAGLNGGRQVGVVAAERDNPEFFCHKIF